MDSDSIDDALKCAVAMFCLKEVRERQGKRPRDNARDPEGETTRADQQVFADRYDSPLHRGVKNAVDLHDVIVEQALDLDHRAGWIWRLAPQLRLRLVHHGREAV